MGINEIAAVAVRKIGIAAMENMGNGGGSNSGVSSIVTEMANLGIGLGVAGQVVSTIKDTVSPMINQPVHEAPVQQQAQNGWDCPECGNKNIQTMFCLCTSLQILMD